MSRWRANPQATGQVETPSILRPEKKAKAAPSTERSSKRTAEDEVITMGVSLQGGSSCSGSANPTQPATNTTPQASAQKKRPAEVPVENIDPRSPENVEDFAGNLPSVSALELSGLSLDSWKAELLDSTCNAIKAQFANQCIEITDEELTQIACVSVELGSFDLDGVDVAEIYSPHRFTAMAGSFGLSAGFAADLLERKADGEFWDLTREADIQELWGEVESQDPYLLTGSPPCEAFSALLAISAHKRDPAVVQQKLEIGQHHIRTAASFYKDRLDRGRYFLHEAPWTAKSWEEPEIQALVNDPRCFKVKGPMCRWDMWATDKRGLQGSGFVRKETGWLTNSPILARILEGRCSNVTGEREWHRHVHLIGGLAKAARIYPPKLVAAVLNGLREQMKADGDISALEAFTSGPVPEIPIVQEGVWTEYWDDVNGTWLRSDLVAAARELELAWVKKQGVYTKVSIEECYAKTGRAPISLRWIDTNKGDDDHPNYRSRLVAREIKAKKTPTDQLPASQVFSAMPPLEGSKILCSLMMSLKVSSRGKPLKLGFWDISRAHFYGIAQREVYVRLPDEDYTEGQCGLLQKGMYGTQDASNLWQNDYLELLEKNAYVRGRSNAATVYNPISGTRGLVHGDDFMVLGDEDALNELDVVLRSRYELKRLGTLGPEPKDDKEVTFLNRIIRYVEGSTPKVEWESDSRHVELIVRELGLEHAKGVDTPAVRKKADEVYQNARLPALNPEETDQW